MREETINGGRGSEKRRCKTGRKIIVKDKERKNRVRRVEKDNE